MGKITLEAINLLEINETRPYWLPIEIEWIDDELMNSFLDNKTDLQKFAESVIERCIKDNILIEIYNNGNKELYINPYKQSPKPIWFCAGIGNYWPGNFSKQQLWNNKKELEIYRIKRQIPIWWNSKTMDKMGFLDTEEKLEEYRKFHIWNTLRED
jgi:hypothetical protein